MYQKKAYICSVQKHHIMLDKMNLNNIKWLLTDSRSLSYPESTLFFALRTPRHDGHLHIPELYKRGVRHYVVDTLPSNATEMPEAKFHIVPSPIRTLQHIATQHRNATQHIPIIGITGSNGKTIVKEWLYQLMHTDRNITRSPRSYNSQIGVPLSVWQLAPTTQLGIFEAGISQCHEMEHLQPIIAPTIGIFTNLGDAHQEHFQSLEQKCAEKLRLFANVQVLIYNKDQHIVDHQVQAQGLATFTWGYTTDADLQVLSTAQQGHTTLITYIYKGNTVQYTLPFTDKASIENSLQCLCCMLHLGYSTEVIAQRMPLLEPVAMRLEVKDGTQGCKLINDSYNSDLTSLHIALDFLDQQAHNQGMPKAIILSDMTHSNTDEQALYHEIATLLHNRGIDHIIGIGTRISQYKEVFQGSHTAFFESTDQFIAQHAHRHLHNLVVLLKGARHFQFERISKLLETTAHETVLEVNLTALVHNVNTLRNTLHPDTKVMGMVKAYAYGSGAIEVAHALQHHGCNYLAVAVADEGAELRRSGIHLPIVVMDPYPSAFDTIFEHHLEPEIYSFKLLHEFIQAADRQGITDYPIHIKIDSGMHRLGFTPDQLPDLCHTLCAQSKLCVRSVFTHLAAADEPQHDSFTHQQLDTFHTCATTLSEALPYPIMRHVLNSAGAERFPDHQYEMVRLGILCYGISALPKHSMLNVCSLRSVLLQIKTISAGQSIGYGRNTILSHDTTIGIIPIGYADGLDRKLGNGCGHVWVDNRRCPIIGNICMDLAIIDLTGTEAQEGDPVEIFGENIPLDELAEKTGTISYEILTGISRRVKRVYYQE